MLQEKDLECGSLSKIPRSLGEGGLPPFSAEARFRVLLAVLRQSLTVGALLDLQQRAGTIGAPTVREGATETVSSGHYSPSISSSPAWRVHSEHIGNTSAAKGAKKDKGKGKREKGTRDSLDLGRMLPDRFPTPTGHFR